MCVYFGFLGLHLPSYGALIAAGVIFANMIAVFVTRKYQLSFDDFIILEAYAVLGGFLGAKILYLIVSADTIEWNRLTELSYFNSMMQGGFVFYGGLIGGLATVAFASKVHHIAVKGYIRHCLFLVPAIHCFGRLGCFFAGCCYGMPYHGIGAVVFPENSFAPAGVELFPIQLLEAFCLGIIAFVMLAADWKNSRISPLILYLLLYGVVRFVLEFFRYDAERGYIGSLSTSQWISIGLVLAGSMLLVMEKRKCNVEKKIK